MDRRNNTIARLVQVGAGQSWYSQQLALSYPNSGIGFEVRVDVLDAGTAEFIVRGGASRRDYCPAEVTNTDTTVLDGSHLPALSGLYELPDLSEAPREWFINIGNVNAAYVELEFRVTNGTYILSVKACEKRG